MIMPAASHDASLAEASQHQSSWVEARARAEGRAAEFLPGSISVNKIASHPTARRMLRRSVWMGLDSGMLYRCAIFFAHSAHFGFSGLLLPYLLRTYVGASIFTAAAIVLSHIAYFPGKGVFVRQMRRKTSPCLAPFRYLTAEQLKPVRDLKIMQLFSEPSYSLYALGLQLNVLATMTTILAAGWQLDWPRWVWGTLLGGQLAASLVENPLGLSAIPAGATDLFVRSASAVVVAIDELRVYHRHPRGGFDWPATYRNYDALCAFVECYSHGWRWYFFGVEFFTVPCAGLSLLGFVQASAQSRHALHCNLKSRPSHPVIRVASLIRLATSPPLSRPPVSARRMLSPSRTFCASPGTPRHTRMSSCAPCRASSPVACTRISSCG